MEELLHLEAPDTTATDPRDAEVLQMLGALLRCLVDRPGELSMVTLVDAGGVCFQVNAATDDLGKLIGRNGRTARAIRTILSGVAAKAGRRYSVDFGERTV